MLETSGPVPAFTDAVQARDVNRIAGLLAHDVRLSVPPLHYARHGTQDVIGALLGLLQGFGELRYDLRSRYVAPGTVTDEAVVVGRQTAPFLGAAPREGVSSVATRVIFAHDAATITSVTVWPDVAALQAAVNGASRVIDLTRVGDAGAVVAQLRATIPPTQAKLIIGTSREVPPPVAAPVGHPGDAVQGPLGGRPVPKPPVPRTVRRRRGLVAGSAMIALSTMLTVWVAVGALRQEPGDGLRTAGGRSSAGSQAGGTAARGPGGAGAGSTGDPGSLRAGDAGTGGAGTGEGGNGPAGAGGTGAAASDVTMADVTPPAEAPPEHLDRTRVSVTLLIDDAKGGIFFPTAKFDVRPAARTRLTAYARDARAQHRTGVVLVQGYTDSIGSPQENQVLSDKRARSVAAVLRAALAGSGMTVRAVGYGESRPVASNATEAGRTRNRRVVVVFPHAPGHAPVSPGRGGAGA